MGLTIYERAERAMVGAGSKGVVRAVWLRVAAFVRPRHDGVGRMRRVILPDFTLLSFCMVV